MRSGESEHGVVEYVEVFRAHVELYALGQIKTAAEREIGLVDRVRAAQAVPRKIPSLPYRWRHKGRWIQSSAGWLRGIGDPVGLSGDGISLTDVGA